MALNVYQIVTDRVLAGLESGTVPWKKPWGSAGIHAPINWKSGKPYRGFNVFMLEGGEWASYKQISEAKGQVPAGMKGRMVTFFKPIPKKEATANSPEQKGALILKYYTVFPALECGLESKRVKPVENKFTPVQRAEAIMAAYVENNGPTLRHVLNDRAYYSPSEDLVNMPLQTQFPGVEGYYNTLFHEGIHSTGHKSREDRDINNVFGNHLYSKEELVAEMGAAMIMMELGLDSPDQQEQTIAYCQSWGKAFKDDPRMIVSAGGKAQKAVDRILGSLVVEEEEAE